MKVALVTPSLSGHLQRGIGVYTQNLISQFKMNKRLSITECTFETIPKDADIVHFTYFDPFFLTLPFIPPKNMILTIHDFIPIRFPQHFPRGIKGTIKWEIQKNLAKQATAFITDSEASQKDIHTFLNVSVNRIYPIFLGVEKKFFQKVSESKKTEIAKKYGLPKKYALFVGDIGWNKNLHTALQAARIAKLHMVLASKTLGTSAELVSHPSHQGWLKSVITELNKTPHTVLSSVDFDELRALYQSATVFLFPSYYEGFGLPVIEAFASGCPVITTHNGSLREVAADAAIIMDADNVKSGADALESIVKDTKLRKNYIEKGLKRAADFSWEKTAAQTIIVYEEVLTRSV